MDTVLRSAWSFPSDKERRRLTDMKLQMAVLVGGIGSAHAPDFWRQEPGRSRKESCITAHSERPGL